MSRWTAEPSTLYVVATPIGNLDDLSARAAAVLRTVDWVAAEDTRQTRKLMAHLGATARLHSVHRGNEAGAVAPLLAALQDGASGALVSDAGTPLISDPGRRLVAAAQMAGVPVSPLPGPSAVAAALSVAGLEAARFAFEGFLPARAPARRRRLAELAQEPRTWVAYEAPHRIRSLLHDMQELLEADRTVVWMRELTKRHEQMWRGRLGDVQAEQLPERGEYVVVVEGAVAAGAVAAEALDAFLRPVLAAGVGVGTAAGLARDCLGASRKAAYARALELAGEADR